MTHYETRVRTPWPVEQAFTYLSDPSNYDQWDPGTKEAVALDSGPPAVGSRFRLRVGRTTLEYEIVELDAPRRVVVRAEDRFLTSQDTVTVEPNGDGSLVTYHAHLALNGLLRLGDALLAVVFRRMGEQAADGLAHRLDGVRRT